MASTSNGPPINKYDVYFSLLPEGQATLAGTTDGTTTIYSHDTSEVKDGLIYYTVQASNEVGLSLKSVEI